MVNPTKGLFVPLTLLSIFNSAGAATELLINGGFETGNFTGWTTATLTGSSPGSSFFVSNSLITPLSNSPTVGTAAGVFYAVTDQLGPSTHALLQNFTVPGVASSVILSFSMFANSYSPAVVIPGSLDFSGGPNQHARVDLLASGAGNFDTGAAVLRNFFLGADPGLNLHAYTNYSFDITSQVGLGGAFRLRFAEVANLNFFNLGVDRVSVDFIESAIPEPGTFLVFLPLVAVIAASAGSRAKYKSS